MEGGVSEAVIGESLFHSIADRPNVRPGSVSPSPSRTSFPHGTQLKKGVFTSFLPSSSGTVNLLPSPIWALACPCTF